MEWILGLLAGVLATFVGFILSILWEKNKSTRQDRDLESKIKIILSNELKLNKEIVDENTQMIEQENKVLNKGKYQIAPLAIINTGFLEIVKINMPKKMKSNPEYQRNLFNLLCRFKYYNDLLRTRDTFKISNQALTHLNNTIKCYNEIIINYSIEIQNDIDTIIPLI